MQYSIEKPAVFLGSLTDWPNNLLKKAKIAIPPFPPERTPVSSGSTYEVRAELLPNVVFRENCSGDDFGMSCRELGGR